MAIRQITFFLIMFIQMIFGCSRQPLHKSKDVQIIDCSEIIIKSSFYIVNYQRNHDKRSLDSALNILNTPINCDEKKRFRIAQQKITVLLLDKNYNQASIVIDSILLFKKPSPQYIVMKGILHEEKGNMDSARYYYQRANFIYDNLLGKKPTNTSLIIEKIWLICVYKGKQQARDELNAFIKKDPENEVLQLAIKELDEFRKEDLLK